MGQWVKKKMEMVVIKEGNGKDNGVIVFIKNPAIIQELIKKVKKKVIYRSRIIEYNSFYSLLYKIKIINKIRFKTF